MNRRELVRRLVLNEISDDYENVDQVILRNVAEIGARCGLTIVREEIVETLGELVREGLAKAYLLSVWEPFVTELDKMPPLKVVEEYFETYFYISRRGSDVRLSNDTWWPFDDDGNLRRDWTFDQT